jgi:hypothetical protein
MRRVVRLRSRTPTSRSSGREDSHHRRQRRAERLRRAREAAAIDDADESFQRLELVHDYSVIRSNFINIEPFILQAQLPKLRSVPP